MTGDVLFGGENPDVKFPESSIELNNKYIEPKAQTWFPWLTRDIVLGNTAKDDRGLFGAESESVIIYRSLGLSGMAELCAHSVLSNHVISRGVEGKGMRDLNTQWNMQLVGDDTEVMKKKLDLMSKKLKQGSGRFWR